ncbi:hypothetical protein Poli38472_006849 [Pythium oligandrum]|uniref:DUF4246 domain-containing protein n=1 Tax=Pythium oligandrum TaxID=41045 RepID=A0A8K1C5I3_PYTOL|nr:hypothetical protein Poli38472_006849 [Pythium oligandrum]|eukprot:TMW56839.1 hypothetical protein Poli38472_006849 [Pythium oligandrum]
MRWLPTNVRIRIDGGVEFLSYINNQHPVKYQATYESIALGFRAMVPLFERVTTGLRGPKPISYIPSLFDLSKPTGNLPLPAIVSLRGSVVQAVFALHEWSWDPMADEPVGTSEWDGTDDAVLTVGHMVVQTENVSTARLAFCQNLQSTVTSFGGRPEPQWEDAGSIACLDNRCIVHPGYYQHQIKLAERVDATTPSSIRLLTISLLDPKKPVVSTSEVPPQRLDWIQEAILQPISRSRGLPVDLERRIMEMLGVGMSVDEARRHRAAMRV